METVTIGSRRVGTGEPCFIIAEAGVNHNGALALAKQLVDAAVAAGADAVKFQTFKAERLVTTDAPKAEYQIRMTGKKESQFEMLKRLELSDAAHQELFDYCQQRKILFLSTPFDEESADFLQRLGVAAFKVPSGELTNLLLLAHVARKGRPLIVSTGMATFGEVTDAMRTITGTGNRSVILLHCVSNYPADPAEVNLRAIQTLARAFRVPAGYSDHTMGADAALAAVALGACVLEKHLTLDRTLPGPDHQASAQPEEFAALIRSLRTVERALGDGRKVPAPSERAVALVARKSLVAARDIPGGGVVPEECVAIKRPGTGLPPSMRGQVIGRHATKPIRAGTVLTKEMFQV